MPVGGIDASNEGRYSTNGFSDLPVEEAIQEKNKLKPRDEEDLDMVEEPILDNVTVDAGVPPNVETAEDLDPDRMKEDQNLMNEGQVPSVDRDAEVSVGKDLSSVIDHNRVQDAVIQPGIADQNPTELEHGEENQNALDGNVKVSFIDNGAEVIHTRDISSVTDHNRVLKTVMQPGLTDQNPVELEHGEENSNALDRKVKVSIVHKGKIAVNVEGTSNVVVDTEDTSNVAVRAEGTSNVAVNTEGASNVAVNAEGTYTLTGKKRDIRVVGAPSIMDWNPTAQTYTVII